MYIKLVSVLTAVLFLLSCQQEGDDKEKEQPETGNTEQQYDPPTESDKAERPPNQQQNQPQRQMPMQQQQNIDVSDEDLQKFSNAIQQVQIINQSSQQDMIKAVQDEGLNVQKFTQIQQAQQNPEKNPDATEKEMKQFQSSMQKIQKIQTDTRAKIENKIKEMGMTMQEYQRTLSAIQQSPELQQKFQKMQQSSQNNDSK